MHIVKAEIKNFRLLEETCLSFDRITTVIVGRNNTGKTSLSELFYRFVGGKKPIFQLEDFSLSRIGDFRKAFDAYQVNPAEDEVRRFLPTIKLILAFDYSDDVDNYGILSDFIIDLDEGCKTIKVEMAYSINSGGIKDFFKELDATSGPTFIKTLRSAVPKYYSAQIFAIDPTDETNQAPLEFSKLYRIIGIDFIHAQRGLDDETAREKDYLGGVLTTIFKSGTNNNAPFDLHKLTEDLKATIEQFQAVLDGDFKERVVALMPALNIFGYPGLSDPKLTTETVIDIERILESNTMVRYDKGNSVSLPETYNGLGSRNLIYILFQLFSYFRKFQSNDVLQKNHIIYIEEPEAHLHPQMQEVFIRKLEEISLEFAKSLNAGKTWPVQFVVSTHSTHIANEANFSSVRYFLTEVSGDCTRTAIRDLGSEFNSPEVKQDRDFIHKYLTLTKCDLFFADKAIMFEGPTERILMPEFVNKIDRDFGINLASQYISQVEIGGAYAHHFFKFLAFLNIKTVLITDIDSVRIDTKSSRNKSCVVSEGTVSSNKGLNQWFLDVSGEAPTIQALLAFGPTEKTRKFIRLAYQTPEDGQAVTGRSFEEAFLLANPTKFELGTLEGSELERLVTERALEIEENGKANFAIDIALGAADWAIPKYISESLIWLSE